MTFNSYMKGFIMLNGGYKFEMELKGPEISLKIPFGLGGNNSFRNIMYF